MVLARHGTQIVGAILLATIPAAASAQARTALVNQKNPAAPSPGLERMANLDVRGLTLAEALIRLYDTSGTPISFSPSMLPPDRRVTCACGDLTVAEALAHILEGTAFRFREIEGHVLVYSARILDLQPEPVRSIAPPTRYASGSKQLVLVPAATLAIAATSAPSDERDGAPPVRGSISGRVTDASTNQPIPFASVRITDSRLSTSTDSDGTYRVDGLAAGTHAVVAFSLGYAPATQNVILAGPDDVVTLDFALQVSAVMLDEIVATVTGDRRRLEIGNAIGRIDANALAAVTPITSVTDLVNARVAGAQVINLTGMTGASPEIRIRGVNSLSVSNAPLFIVDGVRVNNQGGSNSGTLAGFGHSGGRLNDLNPDEVETIEIVKGPSAATLYGTDAANGVIVITTRRGRSGPPAWTTYGEIGTVEPAERFLDNYYSWGHAPNGTVRQCTLIQSASGACEIDRLTTFNPMEDPRTSPLGTGLRHQAGMQVRGGVDRFTYFLSADHEKETGYLEMPEVERAMLRAERGVTSLPDDQLRPNWTEKLSLRANTGATFGKVDLSLSNGLVLGETQIPSPGSITSPGEYGQGFDNPDTFGGWYQARRPAETFSIRNTEEFSRYTGSISGSWRPAPWLTGRLVVGLDLSNTMLDALQRNGEGPIGQNREGRRQNTQNTTSLYSADLGLSSVFQVTPAISSRTSIGAQFNQRTDQLTSVTASQLPPGSETIRGAALLMGVEVNNETIVAGTYIEEVVGVEDRLFLTGAVRFDGGSSFGQDFQTAVYPKASVSWLALDRGMDGPLNTVRLRGAYGASGVQPGATAALTLYEVFTAYVNGANTAGARPSTLGNPDLKPERQAEFEAGIDATILRGRMTLEATYYNRLSRDALLQRALSPDVGVTSQWVNIGSVRNSGWEGLVNFRAVETDDFAWDLTLNGSVNDNKLEKLGLAGIDGLGPLGFRHVEGYPLYGRWERPLLSYDDANGNGIIEPDEVEVGTEPVYRGPGIPPRQLTFTTGVEFLGRAVRVAALFDHRGGMMQENGAEWNRCSATIANCRAVNDPTTPLDQQARVVALNFQEKATFTRWRELSVSLRVPERFTRWLDARSAVLSLTGRNLALFTDYSGKDPEASSIVGNPLAEGYQGNPTVPQSRYWILRLTLGF